MNKVKDSTGNTVIFTQKFSDSLRKAFPGRRDRMLQFLFDIDSLQDSIKIVELDSAFQKRLKDQNLDIPFVINRLEGKELTEARERMDGKEKEPAFNEVPVGFRNPITYRLTIHNKTAFILKRIAISILFS
jgi:two-component system phosphate regulon sensor histidine kinase PhoR